MKTVVIGCGDAVLQASIMRACTAHLASIDYTSRGISVCSGIDIQKDDVSFEFNYSGWGDAFSKTEEVMRLTNMAIESLAKSYSFDPDAKFTSLGFRRDYMRGRDITADRMAFKIKEFKSCEQDEYIELREVPHYRDLEFKKKKKRF